MHELIASNKRRTAFLMAVFVVLLILVGMAVGVLMGNGTGGTVIALVVAGAMAFGGKAAQLFNLVCVAHSCKPLIIFNLFHYQLGIESDARAMAMEFGKVKY